VGIGVDNPKTANEKRVLDEAARKAETLRNTANLMTRANTLLIIRETLAWGGMDVVEKNRFKLTAIHSPHLLVTLNLLPKGMKRPSTGDKVPGLSAACVVIPDQGDANGETQRDSTADPLRLALPETQGEGLARETDGQGSGDRGWIDSL
jgi:hypothetical protein